MPEGTPEVGAHAFRGELDDHEERIAALEAGGGGGGGGPLKSITVTRSLAEYQAEVGEPKEILNDSGKDWIVRYFSCKTFLVEVYLNAVGVEGFLHEGAPGQALDFATSWLVPAGDKLLISLTEEESTAATIQYEEVD